MSNASAEPVDFTASGQAVIAKTQELCQSIIDSPELKDMLADVEAFMEHDEAKNLFTAMQQSYSELMQKQEAGKELTAGEMNEFQKKQEAVMNHPISKKFLEARERIDQVQNEIGTWVSMTFELGRLPTQHEIDHAGCGDCGCSH